MSVIYSLVDKAVQVSATPRICAARTMVVARVHATVQTAPQSALVGKHSKDSTLLVHRDVCPVWQHVSRRLSVDTYIQWPFPGIATAFADICQGCFGNLPASGCQVTATFSLFSLHSKCSWRYLPGLDWQHASGWLSSDSYIQSFFLA